MVSSAYNLEHFIREIEYWGLSDVLLPFMLIFMIIFAILSKSKILGERKGVNMAVAFVMGLTPVVLHVTHRVPRQWDVVEIMNNAIPGIALVVIALIALVILLATFGGGFDKQFKAATIGFWSIGLIVVFIVNSTRYVEKNIAFIVSLFAIGIMIFSTFKTGLPGLYDLIIAFTVSFVFYMFSRQMQWWGITKGSKWFFDGYLSGLFITFIIIILIVSFALSDKSDQKKAKKE